MLDTVLIAGGFAFWALVGYWLGWRRARRNVPRILVRPHTRRTAARMPLPEVTQATVVEAAFVRTNQPGSNSTME